MSGSRSLLLLGGARSGKSSRAERLALRAATTSGAPVSIVVTGVAVDDEMAARIKRHQEDRPASFATVEAPLDLVGALQALDDQAVVVIDCLTVWLSNRMVEGAGEDQLADEVAQLAKLISKRTGDTIVVSNEVGLGIVPMNAMAREFRDIQGRANATLAEALDEAVLMVAGRALRLSDPAELWPS